MQRDNCKLFGRIEDQEPVYLFVLNNSIGSTVEILSYGATIRSFQVVDSSQNVHDVVLGFDAFEDYLQDKSTYLGSICGRVINRIKHGKFSIDNQQYHLTVNGPPNHFHGGFNSFSWKNCNCENLTDSSVTLSLTSPDGDEGYPGNLITHVTYLLNDDNELKLAISATTDAPTIVDISSHVYFNLDNTKTIFDTHRVRIPLDKYLPNDENEMAIENQTSVDGSQFDLREFRPLPIESGKPVNFANFYFDKDVQKQNAIRMVGSVRSIKSNLQLDVSTTQPGVVFYNAYNLNTSGANGKEYVKFGAVCFETQSFPNGINMPRVPNCILRPNETYMHETIFRVTSVQNNP